MVFRSGSGGSTRRVAGGLCLALALSVGAGGAGATTTHERDGLDRQWERYRADAVENVVELAPLRETVETTGADGATWRLTDLHPGIGAWFLLERRPAEGSRDRPQAWHLENAAPGRQAVTLVPGDPPALALARDGTARDCPLLAETGTDPFAGAAKTGLPYAPVCDGGLFLRNAVAGSRTNREAVSEFLRENVIFGEDLVNLIKGSLYEDAFLETGTPRPEAGAGAVVESLGRARLDRQPVMRTSIGLPLTGAEEGMEAGSWYAVDGVAGVFASAMQPGMIEAALLSDRAVNWLDEVERRADVYLVAFDLGVFTLGYELGTDHPGLEWSSRPQRSGADWRIPGPDGFDRAAPLVRTGMLSPAVAPRVAAAFAGGFKRDHGAFRFADYATFNRGHHYGFISNGVTFSRLQPNLATLYVTLEGEIAMKTWEAADEALIPRLAFARQNGLPLVQRDPETGAVLPGERVVQWGGGNWSGSAEAQLRTLRAGACLRRAGGRQFLIYAYFSSVTPSGMARTFQAYDCDYAMLLDMNSPELAYLAVYRPNEAGDGLEPMHLARPMAGSDPAGRGGVRIPRFVGFADNRDFLYLLRRE